MRWNFKTVKKTKKEHKCLICNKDIPIGSSCYRKPYCCTELMHYPKYEGSDIYSNQYIGLYFCSLNCIEIFKKELYARKPKEKKIYYSRLRKLIEDEKKKREKYKLPIIKKY